MALCWSAEIGGVKMPRGLVIGNGRLQVNFDNQYGLRDLFYPNVGQENHFAVMPYWGLV
jgi:hypothetical protein